ncbi:hypothetical protein F5Y04DRAFT_278781 [Hypomontagnella monticulosa]|nr:hypothetical protein F5Y04DRAFT_278781 [Hypomontagnella monticulosa]
MAQGWPRDGITPRFSGYGQSEAASDPSAPSNNLNTVSPIITGASVMVGKAENDILDHIREAMEVVEYTDGLNMTENEFREELVSYLERNYRNVGTTQAGLEDALAKGIATEILRAEIKEPVGNLVQSSKSMTERIMDLLDRAERGDVGKESESPRAIAAKINLVRRIINDKGFDPEYDRSLVLQTDLTYQVIERSRGSLLSGIDDWDCYCGGDDCCQCPGFDSDKAMEKNRNYSDPGRLWFACFCNCCPCGYQDPGNSDPDPSDGRMPDGPSPKPPLSLLCQIIKIGFCPF